MKVKFFLKFIIVIIVAFIIEMGIFNIKYFIGKFDSKEYNLLFTLEDMSKVNWHTGSDGKIVTENDANLIIEKIDTYVDTIYIEYDVNKNVSDVSIFYTDDKTMYFNGNNIVNITNPANCLNISLKKQVNDLRIDLSDEKGIRLEAIKVIINPLSLDISYSRIIAIILIYYSFIALFALQRSPTFDI